MAEAVKVIVRCRPMNEREKNLNCKTSLFIEGSRAQATIKNPHDEKAPPKNFTFDGAYYIDSTTEQIYSDIGYPLVEGVTEGYNGTIFAYGQTGCGKSFTMQGITNPPTQRGIIPRAFDHIFETVSVSNSTKFLIHASYLEIYNEEIRDLLGKDSKQKLDLKEHPEKGVYVNGLSLHPVHNVLECERVMDKGWKNRSTGATLMNADSSRSHSIFTINLEMCTPDAEGEEHIRAGKLNLVDLAGSERQGKTGSTGERLKEATKINLSLSALGNVISALVDGKSKHIPYRDSKLTRMLQDSLGGNTKTLMVACLSPADNNYDETLSTLRYANRAKNIKNKPKINEDPKDALLREYQEEIEKLKAMLMGQIPLPDGGFDARAAPKSPSKSPAGIDRQQLAEEKERLREEYEAKIDEMTDLYEEERITKAKLQEDMVKLRRFYDESVANVEGQMANLPPTAAEEEKPGYDESTVIKPTKQKHYKKKLKKRERSEETVEEEEETEDQESVQEEESYAPEDVEQANKEVVAIESKELIMGEGGIPYEEQGEDYRTPDASPEGLQEHMTKQQEEALKRLQELQSQMVGGEKANNTEIQERIKKKKQHVEDRNKQLAEALALLDDDGIMRNIYVSIQDELKAKNECLDNAKLMNESQEREILDLQSEFQFERIDYLDTIRKQEKQLKLMQSLLDKIHPCLRKDCNYTNLDKIKMEAKWDEDDQKWILPKLIINRTALPVTDTTLAGSRIESRSQPMASPLASPRASMNGELQGSHFDFSDDDKLYQRLSGTERSSYFTPKRASQLLNTNEPVQNFSLQEVKSSVGMSKNRSKMNGFSDSEPQVSHGVRAAQVHGQMMNDSEVRKPTRLDALPTLGGRKGKKKKGGYDGY